MNAIIDEDLAAYALACADVAFYAEARMEETTGTSIVMSNGQVEGAEQSEQRGLSMRVLVDGAMGFAATNILTRQTVRETARQAVRNAARQHKKQSISFAEYSGETARWSVAMDEQFPGWDTKIAFLQALDRLAAERTISRFFSYDDAIVHSHYCNTDGAAITSTVPRLSLYYLVTVAANGDTEQMNRQFGNTGGWEHTVAWNAGDILDHDLSFLHRLLREGKTPPEGTLDMVIGPYVSGIIAHESCGHPFEADRILGREAAQAGTSFVTPDMLGTRIGNSAVSVIDDPTIPNSYGYYRYDDEGIPATHRYLIRDGVIKSFLHNRESACHMDTTSNGAARAAAYNREPIVRMANTYIEPGDHTLEELIADIDQGIYMATFMEWNIDDRRYNQKYVGEEAYAIENGEITHPVRHPALEITTPGFYQSVDAVGDTLELHPATCGKGDPMQPMPVTTGGPSLRLREVRIR
ncbi:MAG: TldD/PmbA family protein [Thermoplasmatota archaeon]